MKSKKALIIRFFCGLIVCAFAAGGIIYATNKASWFYKALSFVGTAALFANMIFLIEEIGYWQDRGSD